MKKNFKTKSKNRKVLESFIEYCIVHPEERFWQALRNWSGAYSINYEDYDYRGEMIDTFYFEGKEK